MVLAQDSLPQQHPRHRRTQLVRYSREELVLEANRLFGGTDRPKLRLFLPGGPGGNYLLARLRYDWEPLGIGVERANSPASADVMAPQRTAST